MNKLQKSGLILSLLIMSNLPVSAEQQKPKTVRDISNIQVNENSLRAAVASRTLTWLTGSSSNNDYVSVGRMANFFGFVAFRVSSGHSLSRGQVSKHTLAVLNDTQRRQLISLVNTQKPPFEQTGKARFNMNRALEGLLVGEKISRNGFLVLGRKYGASEAELGRVLGQVFGSISQTLTADQKSQLVNIREAHQSGLGADIDLPNPRIKLPRADKKELTNLAARLLSWTTGTQDFNDFEVVGKPSQHFGFVSLRIESNHGVRRGDIAKQVLALLTPEQQKMLDVAAAENIREFNDFLAVRARLMRTLEVALSGKTIDRNRVKALGSAIGEREASMTWSQAQAMLKVRNTLSDSQSAKLLAMRTKYTAAGKANLPENPIERGRQLFAQCALCHSSNTQQSIGPSLDRIVGAPVAGDPFFSGYSSALRQFSVDQPNWTEQALNAFLQSPKSLVPGTYMGFDGIGQSEDRVAVITYLKSRL